MPQKIAINIETNEEVVVFGFQLMTVEGWVITEWAPNQYLAARYARGLENNPYRVKD